MVEGLLNGPDAAGDETEPFDPTEPYEIHVYCEPGAEGQPPIAWPMPAPQLIEAWVIEPVGEAVPASAVRVDRGPDGVLDLVRCGG
jgi:hypothetical protein